MTPAQAGHWLRFFQRRFSLLPDREELTALWQGLVEAQGVTGFKSYDIRLVAAMQSYGMTRLLTFNGGDFRDMPRHGNRPGFRVAEHEKFRADRATPVPLMHG